ncbi:MAG TPA: tetratricopeptide repeat protein [Geminicoccaceae bacterium]|nr:tetratricopeptide repeat protein [Geminicoccaceae bacterium]
MADGFYDDRTSRASVDPVVRRLQRLYARSDGGIAQLEPDLIGEHHVVAVADKELMEGCFAWIEQQPEFVRPKHRRDLLTVLQRATQHGHDNKTIGRAEALLDLILTKHLLAHAAELVSVMIDTDGNLVRLLGRRIAEMDDESLAAIDFHLPPLSVSLMDVSLRVAEQRVVLARAFVSAIDRVADVATHQREAALGHLAAQLNTLSIRLAAMHRPKEALAAIEEAVDMSRQLAMSRPDAFLLDLAVTLGNLGNRLAELGRREEALAASHEAVEIRRSLVVNRPDAFKRDLAMGLHNTAAMLRNLGRLERALAAIQEAVEILRRLAAAQPDAILDELAASLHNAGAILSDVGQREEALEAVQEAVDILRQLASAWPDAFLPDLA